MQSEDSTSCTITQADCMLTVHPFSATPIKHIVLLRHNFTLKLVFVLAFGTPKFYIAPYDKINHGLVNLSYNCNLKFDLKMVNKCSKHVTR